MKTETPPTIAELWGEFEQMSSTGNPCYIHSREGEQWEAMFRSLRQQLVERCKVPCYNLSASPLGEIEYHKEMSAIHGFWAWELEQRQREAQP